MHSRLMRRLATLAGLSAIAPWAGHSQAAGTPPQTQPAPGQTQPTAPRRGPRPYAQVITERAVTDVGGITVHRLDESY